MKEVGKRCVEGENRNIHLIRDGYNGTQAL
jgi:hypothetical protein